MLSNDHHHIELLYFDYGQLAGPQELPRVVKFAESIKAPMHIVNLKEVFSGMHSSILEQNKQREFGRSASIVPFRNGIFLSIAAGFADDLGFDAISCGIHLTTGLYPDNSREFLESITNAIGAGTVNKVKTLSLIGNMEKHEVIRFALAAEAPLELTWSCFSGEPEPCGTCVSCVQRKEAFDILGVADPLDDETNHYQGA